MRYLCCLFSFFTFTLQMTAQYVECDTSFFEPVFKSRDLNKFCELNADMPSEVMLSYIALDSVCNYVDYKDWKQFLDNQTSLNDTMKTIMKYFYNLVDYNPILFDKNLRYIFSDFSIHPISVYLDLRKKVDEISPTPMLDRALLYSNYILKVQVNNIEDSVRPNSMTGNSLTIAHCTITDTIKGKIVPYCTSTVYSPIAGGTKIVSNTPSDSTIEMEIGSCIEFVYSPDWTMGESSDFEIRDITGVNPNGILDSLGNSWLKLGEEYLVFLESFEVCRDSTAFYTTLRPLGLQSKTFTMYPIKSDGTVYNPGNDFGLGNMQYSDFISAIRNRINEIKNGRE